jgi:hypothetical protein
MQRVVDIAARENGVAEVARLWWYGIAMMGEYAAPNEGQKMLYARVREREERYEAEETSAEVRDVRDSELWRGATQKGCVDGAMAIRRHGLFVSFEGSPSPSPAVRRFEAAGASTNGGPQGMAGVVQPSRQNETGAANR